MQHTTTSERTAAEFERELANFSGSLTQYRYSFALRLTEGVHHLMTASEGVIGPTGRRCNGAFWLIDAIGSHQKAAIASCDGFQVWTLTVHDDGAGPGATLTCRADADRPPVVTQRIEFTDFPLASMKLYVIDGVVLLPGEY